MSGDDERPTYFGHGYPDFPHEPHPGIRDPSADVLRLLRKYKASRDRWWDGTLPEASYLRTYDGMFWLLDQFDRNKINAVMRRLHGWWYVEITRFHGKRFEVRSDARDVTLAVLRAVEEYLLAGRSRRG
jgi:hypothetical protein